MLSSIKPELHRRQAPEVGIAYIVRLDERQKTMIREAQQRSGKSWPEWARQAIELLEKEDPLEIHSLLESWSAIGRQARNPREKMPFRIYPSTLEKAQMLAERHSGTVQAVIGHALFMRSLSDE